MQEGRLAKAEAKLNGSQRVLAWMHRQQQLGGFVEIATRNVETNLASSTTIIIENFDAAFIFHCVIDCNVRALELNEARLEKGVLALCLNRFRNTPETPSEDWEITVFRRALKVFLLKWKLFDRAVQIITKKHFSGMRVLFDDTAAMLEKEIEEALRFCDLFNVEIAPAFGVEPIPHEEIAEFLQASAHQEANQITSLARAKAELDFGNRFSACPLILEAIHLTDTERAT